jgi:hypothetical protein
MGSGLRKVWRVPVMAAMACTVVATATATAAGAATSADDSTIAQAGAFVAGDFPASFTASPPSTTSHTDNIKLAKGVAGCKPYVKLQKTTATLPQAHSPQFDDGQRSISNETDVFESEKAASAALVLYAKPSVAGCLEHLFEKQLRRDSRVDDVVVTLDRQAIAGLGDDSVVYEGKLVVTGTDGSQQQLGIGSAAVRVGRAVDAVTYSTQGADLPEVLTPAIDASVGRVRAALTGGS